MRARSFENAGLELTDDEFDHVYPRWVRACSALHWTPIAIARRAAELLVTRKGTRVLDVGSGAGKFCIVGALASEGAFVGIEQRGRLVEVARAAARRVRAKRCRFIHGDALAYDWRDFDAYYLYNPFAEHYQVARAIDHTIELAPRRFVEYVESTERQLERARPGARLVIYDGFGGTVPAGWREVVDEAHGFDRLQLCVRG